MKTIYADHLGLQFYKIQISDELDAEIDEARDEVYSIVKRRNWIPSIRIDLPLDISDIGFNHTNFMIDIAWDDGKENNAATNILRILGENEAHGFVRADLGHYCYEGWESDIDYQDLSEIKDVWFSDYFKKDFLEKDIRGYNRATDVLEESHQRALVPELFFAARMELRDMRTKKFGSVDIEEKLYVESFAAKCREVWKNRSPFSDLLNMRDEYQVIVPRISGQESLDDDDEDDREFERELEADMQSRSRPEMDL